VLLANPWQVPVIQGTDLLSSAEDALTAADRIGYPVGYQSFNPSIHI